MSGHRRAHQEPRDRRRNAWGLADHRRGKPVSQGPEQSERWSHTLMGILPSAATSRHQRCPQGAWHPPVGNLSHLYLQAALDPSPDGFG